MEQLKKIGQIKPKKSVEVKKSRIGIGFEKLDRDSFDPENAYPFVAELGVKYARLQSGWQKTEQQKGVYNFEWLDKIVDNLIKIGVEPWLCLCYGNKLYTPMAEKIFGAVGCPPIATETERNAWAAYVKATVQHFKGRIHFFEIWNEPDGQWCWKTGPNAEDLAKFIIDTAKVCKETDPSCEVIGFATCMLEGDFVNKLAEKGVCNYIDAISYHAYWHEDADFIAAYNLYDGIRKMYNPSLKLIQGETGTQSRPDGCGARRGGAWTELKQAKYMLRHLIIDLALDNYFTSYFSCIDMAEALNGVVGDVSSVSDFGYFGVVGAEFDENARATGNYFKKLSFTSLQTLCSIMSEDYKRYNLTVEAFETPSQRMLRKCFNFDNATKYAFRREDGSVALFYWNPKNILTETYDGETSFKISAEYVKGDVELIDMLDGSIYKLDKTRHYIEDGYYVFNNVPITDSPLILTFGGFYNE